MLCAANPVLPLDGLIAVEQEAPVRLFACPGLGGVIGFGQAQGRAVIDRRQAATEQDLALEVQFLRGFIAAIDPARCDQPLEFTLIQIKTKRLPLFPIRRDAQPGQIGANRLDIFLAAAFGIGIVDPQHEAPTCIAGQQPVVQGGADIADVEGAGGAGCKARDNRHARPFSTAGGLAQPLKQCGKRWSPDSGDPVRNCVCPA